MLAAIQNSLSWGACLCGFAGMAAMPLGLGGFAIWRRRQRQADGERRPMDTKLLRPAGYGLLQRYDQLAEEGLFDLFLLAGLGSFLGLGAYGTSPILWGLVVQRFTLAELVNHPQRALFLSFGLLLAGCLLGTAYASARCLRRLRELESVRLGLRGEQAVGEALTDSRISLAGYRVFHDVPGDGAWNVDHVLVGPAGVFVLETKARSKRPGREGQAKHEVLFDGRTLRFPNWDDHETVRQVERNADWVRKFLADYAPPDLAIQPVVVLPGWYVTTQGNYPVKAMNTTYLPTYLAGMRRRFDPDALKAVIRRLDERCRTLEF